MVQFVSGLSIVQKYVIFDCGLAMAEINARRHCKHGRHVALLP